MNFAQPEWLFGAALSLVVASLLIAGTVRAARARKIFGDTSRVEALQTHDASKRRAWKGVFLVLAVALAFVAAARPRYGKGTRLIPATDLDVVLALDYSKSMYARDIEPSRIQRAKIEAARLVKELGGARFGAVAFAGEAMSFPLTADGAAIAQFLRQLEPNDMPVGGTAIGRALDAARDLFRRDPKSKDHKRVVVLITDGEDLEGDPVRVAQAMGQEGTTVIVVQIGGRTPEPVPDVGADGSVRGYRTRKDGRMLTTELSVEGEAALASIAAATPNGRRIVAMKGSTGIDEATRELKRQMKGELAERVETVYADVFEFPLIAALLLLLAEAVLPEAPRRRFLRTPPPRRSPRTLGRTRFARAGISTNADDDVESPWVTAGVDANNAAPASASFAAMRRPSEDETRRLTRDRVLSSSADDRAALAAAAAASLRRGIHGAPSTRRSSASSERRPAASASAFVPSGQREEGGRREHD